MRFDQPKYAKFESKGFPTKTKVVKGDVPALMREFAIWLKDVTMGTQIILTMRRDNFDVGDTPEDAADIQALFEEQFADVADSPDSQVA